MEDHGFIIFNIPLRSGDTPGWENREMASGLKKLIEKYHLSATWLPRFDALNDSRYIDLCRSLNSEQEIGVWLEITSSHASAANVPYRIEPSEEWFWAKYALTMGYSPEQRLRLIDTLMAKFRKVFGRYPFTVAMWMIDSFSVAYLCREYGVRSIGLCRNQYGVDGYTLWGGWMNLPYWPCRNYIWQPAASVEDKSCVLVYPLITEDILTNYGNDMGVWSTETSMIQMHGGSPETIEKYIDDLTRMALKAEGPVRLASIVAENGWDWKRLSSHYEHQSAFLAGFCRDGIARTVTSEGYARWYAGVYPDVSPAQVLFQPAGLDNPFPGSSCITACTRTYRARLRDDSDGRGPKLTDLRVYDRHLSDPYNHGISKERFARWIIPFVLDGSIYGRHSRATGTRADSPKHSPLGISIEVSGSGKNSKESLVRESDRVFVWKNGIAAVCWEFGDETVSVKILPAGISCDKKCKLVLACNPHVHNLLVKAGGRQVPLDDFDVGVVHVPRIIIGNPEFERIPAIEIRHGESGAELVCEWRYEGSDSVLTVHPDAGKPFNLLLTPMFLRT